MRPSPGQPGAPRRFPGAAVAGLGCGWGTGEHKELAPASSRGGAHSGRDGVEPRSGRLPLCPRQPAAHPAALQPGAGAIRAGLPWSRHSLQKPWGPLLTDLAPGLETASVAWKSGHGVLSLGGFSGARSCRALSLASHGPAPGAAGGARQTFQGRAGAGQGAHVSQASDAGPGTQAGRFGPPVARSVTGRWIHRQPLPLRTCSAQSPENPSPGTWEKPYNASSDRSLPDRSSCSDTPRPGEAGSPAGFEEGATVRQRLALIGTLSLRLDRSLVWKPS